MLAAVSPLVFSMIFYYSSAWFDFMPRHARDDSVKKKTGSVAST